MQAVVDATINALQQVVELIELTSSENYKKAPQGGGSPIGRHIRHVLDHFDALKVGLAEGHVDYDQRHRDSAVETDAALAKAHTKSVINWLSRYVKADKTLVTKTEISTILQQSQTVPSSLKRELVYLLNHTLHHSAYAALLLRSFGEQVDENIGLAPCTQNYLNKQRLKEVI